MFGKVVQEAKFSIQLQRIYQIQFRSIISRIDHELGEEMQKNYEIFTRIIELIFISTLLYTFLYFRFNRNRFS